MNSNTYDMNQLCTILYINSMRSGATQLWNINFFRDVFTLTISRFLGDMSQISIMSFGIFSSHEKKPVNTQPSEFMYQWKQFMVFRINIWSFYSFTFFFEKEIESNSFLLSGHIIFLAELSANPDHCVTQVHSLQKNQRFLLS